MNLCISSAEGGGFYVRTCTMLNGVLTVDDEIIFAGNWSECELYVGAEFRKEAEGD